MNEGPIRILLVGEAMDACRLRDLLNTENSSEFHITHVTDLELAAERLASDGADIFLLNLDEKQGLGEKQGYGRAVVQAARAAAPDTPMVILAATEDEPLGVEALRLGVQDFLGKERLERTALV